MKAVSLNINICKSVGSLIRNCDILVIATPWKIFKNINLNKFKNIKVVIDPYNLVNLHKNKNKKIQHIGMGK